MNIRLSITIERRRGDISPNKHASQPGKPWSKYIGDKFYNGQRAR